MSSFIRIITEKPVAYDSSDYIQPWGTARDSSIRISFNRKLSQWIPEKLRVLDLGCSGDGFVKSIIDQGGFAVGIEGSDYSKKQKRAEWAVIPDNLFTADITEPFKLIKISDDNKEQILKFNVITAWEVIEHISSDKLQAVFKNIDLHLAPNGIVIMSISTKEEIIKGARIH
ncbi:MAG: class I SAM-dependent methyltransferase [Patescibacteria group bacterium]